MGYELSILRKAGKVKISTKEWLNLIELDSEFESIDTFSDAIENGVLLSVSTPNAGLWKKKIPFTFNSNSGRITVKNPNQAIILKMVAISKVLDSIVLGEEGEEYDENYKEQDFNKEELLKLAKNLKVKPFNFKAKKWWQIWK